MQCGNNLKQIGIALHNYHGAHNVFPPALLNSGRYTPGTGTHPYPEGVLNTTGWAMMLSFMEQGALQAKYNFKVCSSCSNPNAGVPVLGDDTINADCYGARLSVLECPTAPNAGEISSSSAGTSTAFYSRRNARRTNYLFASGAMTDYNAPYATYSSDIRQGMFGNNGAATFAKILDGSSNCIAIGEAVGGPFKTSNDFGPWGLCGTHTCCHGYVPSSSNTTITYTANDAVSFIINGKRYDDSLGRSYAWNFNSLHPGGAQFLLGDGSTRFIGQTIDYRVFCQLNYIHDGQPIPSNAF